MADTRGFRDLKVYQLAYRLAMEIFNLTKAFPADERFSLTDQIRRSSCSVTANIAEGYRKRLYSKMTLPPAAASCSSSYARIKAGSRRRSTSSSTRPLLVISTYANSTGDKCM